MIFHDYLLGIIRSCPQCDERPFAPGSTQGLLSPGGSWVAALDVYADHTPGVTLYRMPPELAVVRHFPARAEEAAWNTQESPLAITPDAARILLAAGPGNGACYSGPRFQVHVNDVATGSLIDALPPGLSSSDADANTLAYGAQIWRAR